MQSINEKPIIGISIGDINGIGIEVIIKTLQDSRILKIFTPIIYGSNKIINIHRKLLEIKELKLNIIKTPSEALPKVINVINCWKEEPKMDIGQETPFGGQAAFKSLKFLIDDMLANKLDAMVTAPINKRNIQSKTFNFPGHTEYLKDSFNVESNLMFMISNELRIGVVTGHIPLKDVSNIITKELIIDKLKIMNHSLKYDFYIPKPKIAILGLNPHAGEKDMLGVEEQNIIEPAIKDAQNMGINALGAYPTDGFFGNSMHHQFDAVLAMYHDQGLTPFKTIAFDKGVNYTAGMPIIRTSPSHGTGYNLAGKGVANENSFREAIYTAIQIYKNRKETTELQDNKLK